MTTQDAVPTTVEQPGVRMYPKEEYERIARDLEEIQVESGPERASPENDILLSALQIAIASPELCTALKEARNYVQRFWDQTGGSAPHDPGVRFVKQTLEQIDTALSKASALSPRTEDGASRTEGIVNA
jgi:hypothetical protein